MKKSLVAILFGLLLVLSACGGGGTTEGEGGATAADGAEIYKQSCAGCHGADLSGASAPDISKIGANLSVDELQDIVENGFGNMPAVLSGKPDDAKAVAEWLAEKK